MVRVEDVAAERSRAVSTGDPRRTVLCRSWHDCCSLSGVSDHGFGSVVSFAVEFGDLG
jgi:hypothetical protein